MDAAIFSGMAKHVRSKDPFESAGSADALLAALVKVLARQAAERDHQAFRNKPEAAAKRSGGKDSR